MVKRMPNAREGFKRITGEIPVEMYEKITHYNRVSNRTVNVSKTIELCLAQEIKKINEEVIEEAKAGCQKIINDAYYNQIIADTKAGKKPAETHRNLIESLRNDGFKMLHSGAFLPLYPIDKVEHDEATESFRFMAEGVVCFLVQKDKQ
jgi:aspartate ammonia-lyase